MAPRARRGVQRSCRKRSTYLESSSTESDGDEGSYSEDGSAPSRTPSRARGRPRKTTPKVAAATRGAPRIKSNTRSRPRKLARTEPDDQESAFEGLNVPSDGVIPDWTALPYEILVSIYRYAFYPLVEQHIASSNVPQLARALRVCKAFVEPGVTVLYECPPIWLQETLHGLLSTLRLAAAGNALFDYRRKVKMIKLNAEHFLKYTTPGLGKFNLEDMLQHVPLLTDLDLVLKSDFPPYRSSTAPGWELPWTLVEALMESPIKLRGWRWNAFMTSQFEPSMVKQVHQHSVMKGLRRLHLSQIAFIWPFDGDKEARRKLSEELMSPLTELEELTMETCSSEDWVNLSTFPVTLKKLSFINCQNFTSLHLTDFLATHGRNLRSLVLNHNNSLNLSYLTGLRTWCPKLINLEMSLQYYSSLHVTHGDAQPAFEYLLGDKEIPAWPTTLQRIDFTYLRKCSLDAARNFFSSLVDSSKDLADLRSLKIKAILNIGWRDRAGFRDYWIARLNHVFLRRIKSPSLHFASKRAFREWRQMGVSPNTTLTVRAKGELRGSQGTPQSSPQRKSSRLKDKEEATLEAAQLQPLRHSEEEGEDYIQGLCTYVEVSIDNQRPREAVFNENDFMDDEVSGDDDWDGDQVEDEGYIV